MLHLNLITAFVEKGIFVCNLNGSHDLFNDRQFYAMCDCCMSLPVKLCEADLLNPFVYDRRYGLFYVPSGYHRTAMSLLLAFRHNLNAGIQVAKKLNIKYSDETADYYLENIKGTAFKSSVGKSILIGSLKNLNKFEISTFDGCVSIFD
jgi:hypothetical protein